MTLKAFFLLTALTLCNVSFKAQYNALWIPDTLSGVNFNIAVKDTFKQIFTGS